MPKTTAVPSVRKNKQKQKGKNRTTTPKPLHTTDMLNQLSSMKVKNKSKSTTSSFNRLTTTMRPRMSTEVVKPGGGKNGNSLTTKGGKMQESNVHEKSSGKAPKQIKETSTPSPMLKMFERYEKIQEIYPQLKPYRDNENPTFFTISNAKPSRENSKSSNFVSTPQKKDERQLSNKGTMKIFGCSIISSVLSCRQQIVGTSVKIKFPSNLCCFRFVST
jgi:hypothetical protein